MASASGRAGLHTEVLRWGPGVDLRDALVQATAQFRERGVNAACVVSAVGSLSRAVLRYAAEPGGSVLHEPLELITLSGTLSTEGVHLHASVADARGRLYGGHLMPGCIVRTTAEIVLALLPDWQFSRAHDPQTGFKELVARRLSTTDKSTPSFAPDADAD